MKQNKRTAGFTLVELIVVIAIMGILAGVGTVGYSGYIKSANKKADMALVGNVVRAIETGANSGMFVTSDSASVGGTTFPIGFVILNHEATDAAGTYTETYQSGTTMVNPGDKECSFETVPYVLLKKRAGYYSAENTSVTYCTTHSNANYLPKISAGSSDDSYKSDWRGSTTTVPSGTRYCYESDDNTGNLYKASATDSTKCTMSAGQTSATVSSGGTMVANADGELKNAMVAAFGDNYAVNTQLQYDKWGGSGDEAQSYPSIYTYGDDLLTTVRALSDKAVTNCEKVENPLVQAGLRLAGYTKESAYQKILGVNHGYDSASDVISEYAAATVDETTMGRDKFLQKWESVTKDEGGTSSTLWEREGFGYSQRAYYSAARAGYNSCFASYVSANGGSQTAASVICNYYKEMSDDSSMTTLAGILGIETTMPALVCLGAFDNVNSGLKTQFTAAGLSDTEFNKCRDLFVQYRDSGAYAQNGEAFYNTMQTITTTEGDARIGGTDDTFYDYYKDYLNAMNDIYSTAEAYSQNGKSSIIITFVMNGGKLDYSVSPSAADPRNQ